MLNLLREGEETPPKRRLAREPSTVGQAARRFGVIAAWVVLGLIFLAGLRTLLLPRDAAAPAPSGAEVLARQWPDQETQAFAVSAARALLTFGNRESYGDFHELALAPYLSPELDAGTIVRLPERGPPQRVVEASIARTKRLDGNRALLTVAAVVEQRRSTVRYLTLPIARDDRGRLAVYDLPSFSPQPALADVKAPESETIEEGTRRQLERTLEQFFAIYLAGRDKELAAYLPAGSALAALDHGYRFEELVSLGQADRAQDERRPLVAVVKARDSESRATYTLRYHLEVVRSGTSGSGWLVAAINGTGGRR